MSPFKIISPYSGSLLHTLNFSSLDTVLNQLAHLNTNYTSNNSISLHERIKILTNLTKILKKNIDNLSLLISTEMGKPISESKAEINRALITIQSTITESQALRGEALDSTTYGISDHRLGIVNYFPLGIVLCITPFNFPINLALHKLAPGFAAGNRLLFKPSPQTYLSAKQLVDYCYEAGMPDHYLQLIIPTHEDLPNIVSRPEIACVSLTGSPQAARALSKHIGIKKFLCELGGNDPFIVMPDADLGSASQIAVSQRFGTAGQRCNSPKRFYIHDSVYRDFKELVIKHTQALVIGDPTHPETNVGPLVSAKAAETIETQVLKAIANGAYSCFPIYRDKALLHPIILENIQPNSPLITEEIFGPVMVLQSFTNIDSVIQLINASPYGLQAGLFTQDLTLAKSMYQQLHVGALNLNNGPSFRADHFPFSGVKDSGIGSEGSRYTIEAMSHRKLFVI